MIILQEEQTSSVLRYGLSPALRTQRQNESSYMGCYKSMKTNIFKEYILPWEKSHSFNKSINTISAPGLCAKNKMMNTEDIILANQGSYSLLNKAGKGYSSGIPDAKGPRR